MKLRLFALTVLLTSCATTTSNEFTPLDPANIPAELMQTTTTLQVSPTTTVSPQESMPNESTVPEIVNELVELYFISSNRVLATKLPIASPATNSQVLAALIVGPPVDESGIGLRTALPIGLLATVEVSDGVATIDAASAFLTTLTPIDQRLAIAQLVLTFTRRPGIGQIVFSVDGIPIAVPRGRGDLTTPGSKVSFDDYSTLIFD